MTNSYLFSMNSLKARSWSSVAYLSMINCRFPLQALYFALSLSVMASWSSSANSFIFGLNSLNSSSSVTKNSPCSPRKSLPSFVYQAASVVSPSYMTAHIGLFPKPSVKTILTGSCTWVSIFYSGWRMYCSKLKGIFFIIVYQRFLTHDD